MTFEWDPAKSASNKLKHGVSFEEVEEALNEDELIVSLPNPRYPHQRLFVFRLKGTIHTAAVEQRGEVFRLISAQKRRKMEKKYGP